MSVVGALKHVLSDLSDYFPSKHGKQWFLLLAALVLQVAFWYLATPGPTLLRFTPQDPLAAGAAVGWSVILLLLLPALFYRLLCGRLDEAGLRFGDARFGFSALLALLVIAVPLMVLASGDASLRLTYPWPGAWAGAAPVNLTLWIVTYFFYYLAFESFYRGFVLQASARAWGLPTAFWLQVVMATMIHLGKPLPEVLAAAPASMIFAVLALRSRSILYPALLHLAIGVTIDVSVLARAGQLF